MARLAEIACSFCRRSQSNARWLFMQHQGVICDACVDLAAEFLAEKRREVAMSDPPATVVGVGQERPEPESK